MMYLSIEWCTHFPPLPYMVSQMWVNSHWQCDTHVQHRTNIVSWLPQWLNGESKFTSIFSHCSKQGVDHCGSIATLYTSIIPMSLSSFASQLVTHTPIKIAYCTSFCDWRVIMSCACFVNNIVDNDWQSCKIQVEIPPVWQGHERNNDLNTSTIIN